MPELQDEEHTKSIAPSYGLNGWRKLVLINRGSPSGSLMELENNKFSPNSSASEAKFEDLSGDREGILLWGVPS